MKVLVINADKIMCPYYSDILSRSMFRSMFSILSKKLLLLELQTLEDIKTLSDIFVQRLIFNSVDNLNNRDIEYLEHLGYDKEEFDAVITIYDGYLE